MKGSVFPKTLGVSLPCALVTAAIKILTERGYWPELNEMDGVVHNVVWAGFNTLVGFLIVFRTSQAYARFWDGCIWTRQMRAQWFDACSSVVAFCKHSTAAEWRVNNFKELIVRLFCMLHAAAMAEIEDSTKSELDNIAAFNMDLIDPDGIDEASLVTIMSSDSRVELLFQWIQQVIIESTSTGVLSIPAPILSRSFQELAEGMIAFHQAISISYIPFPFPYAQSCDGLLIMHWLVVPIIVSTWTSGPYWAAIFSFLQVFTLWSLNFIAVEIENPFGMDENDLDGVHMQSEMNRSLTLLLRPQVLRTPSLQENRRISEKDYSGLVHSRTLKSFVACWNGVKSRSIDTDLDEYEDADRNAANDNMQSRNSCPARSWRATSSRASRNSRVTIASTSRSVSNGSPMNNAPSANRFPVSNPEISVGSVITASETSTYPLRTHTNEDYDDRGSWRVPTPATSLPLRSRGTAPRCIQSVCSGASQQESPWSDKLSSLDRKPLSIAEHHEESANHSLGRSLEISGVGNIII